MKERILTKEEHILVLETKIAERALIIYVNESALADESGMWSSGYKRAIKDEIKKWLNPFKIINHQDNPAIAADNFKSI